MALLAQVAFFSVVLGCFALFIGASLPVLDALKASRDQAAQPGLEERRGAADAEQPFNAFDTK